VISALDVLDRDGRVVDAEDAGAFARGGAHAAGELGEVVRLVETVEGLFPEAAVDEVVPLRDQVVDRATGGHAADEFARVAERHAAVHAARALIAELLSSMCEWNSFQSFVRSAGARSTGSSRRYSMKPVGLPMGVRCYARLRVGDFSYRRRARGRGRFLRRRP